MGLDTVELLIEVEEHFGVTIADEEAGSIRTVGDLVGLLESRVKSSQTASCRYLPWFLRLRRLTRDVIGEPRRRLRPSQKLADALSPAHRRALWRRLPELLGSRPLPLSRPQPVKTVLVATVIAAVAWVGLAGPADPVNAVVAWLVVFLATITLYLVTQPLRSVPPYGYRTFGEVTQRLVGREAITVGYPTGKGRKNLLLGEIRPILVNQLGVDPDEVTLDARFVEDLNCD